MSKLGKKPISIPKDTKITLETGKLKLIGPMGSRELSINEKRNWLNDIKFAEWDIKVPAFKIKGKEWLKSQVSRAFLPKKSRPLVFTNRPSPDSTWSRSVVKSLPQAAYPFSSLILLAA